MYINQQSIFKHPGTSKTCNPGDVFQVSPGETPHAAGGFGLIPPPLGKSGSNACPARIIAELIRRFSVPICTFQLHDYINKSIFRLTVLSLTN